MQKWHICSATLHHDKSCFEFVNNFKRKLSYSFIHFVSQIVSKKYSSDVFVHKKFQSIELQEDYVFQKKARKSPNEMQIFSSQQLFWKQSPQGIKKTTFVPTHQYTKFCLFFQNVSKLHANFWTRNFYCWHRFVEKKITSSLKTVSFLF